MSHGSFTQVTLLNFLLALSFITCKQVPGVVGSGIGTGSEGESTEYETIRREMIKTQILQRLGLQEKPRVDNDHKLSKDLALEILRRTDNLNPESATDASNVTQSEDDSSNFARTSEIISFPEKGPVLNGHTLLSFSYAGTNAYGVGVRVRKASLWVKMEHKSSLGRHFGHLLHPRGVTLYVFQITGNHQSKKNHTIYFTNADVHMDLVTSRTVMLDALGWQKLDVTQTVQKWYNRNHKHRIRHANNGGKNHHHRDKLTLLVDCAGCANSVEPITFTAATSSYLASNANVESQSKVNVVDDISASTQTDNQDIPFLVLETETAPTSKRNRRRAQECGPRIKQCCKQRFYVSFEDLGWDDWIIAPKGYYANYCRGHCGGPFRTPDTYLNYHTHVLEEYKRTQEGQANLEGIKPCCAPTKFSPMSLIYFGPDYNIIKRDLPKMIVEECGCP